MTPHQKTPLGKYFVGDSLKLLTSAPFKKYRGKIQLIFTSPPFPLNTKKSYGNLKGQEYKRWFVGLADIFSELISERGSIVIELGNSWIPGRPIQSLLPMESLIEFLNSPRANLRLCQQFISYNPSKLPSPAQWVNVERNRVTDSFTHLWWMSKTDYPKADNKKVLRPYSKSMKLLLSRKEYNSGKRPSEHNISPKGFLKNNKGSISPNVFEIEPMDLHRENRLPNAFSFSNTNSMDFF